MKKTLSIFLSIFMLIASISMGGITAYASNGFGFDYEIKNSEVIIIGYTSWAFNSDTISVPSKIDGYPVVKIGEHAFDYCEKKVVLPSSIVEIGASAFSLYNANSDISVSFTIPSSCEKIGKSAFSSANISSITIPAGITEISENAFSNSSLKNVTIKAGVNTIAKRAFADCYNLKTVSIPNTVISIGKYAFSGCSVLDSISIPNSVITIDKSAFYDCKSLTNINIPSSVSTLGENVFSNCINLNSVILPQNMKSIPNGCFSGCKKLENIIIPNKITSIGNNAFSNTKLKKIILPSSLTKIGKEAFFNCSLESIDIPKSIKIIPSSCFAFCTDLKSVVLSDGVETICDSAFGDTAITTLNLPKSVKSFSSSAFSTYGWSSSSKIKKITVSKYNKNYSSYDGALYNKDKTKLICCPFRKTSIKYPKGLKSIGEGAFGGSKMKQIKLPKTVTSLEFAAFSSSQIETINIPGKVKTIPTACFANCDKLTNVKIPNSITKICSGAFTKLKEIDIPNSVKTIEDEALNCCLRGITIPSSVKNVGAFDWWEGTELVYIAGYKGTAAEKCWKNCYKDHGVEFVIAPKKQTIKSLTSPKSGTLAVKWSKDTKASGYEIQISTSSTMSENTKAARVGDKSKVFLKTKGLKKGKNYYVQVRTYTNKKIKGTTYKIYGEWSSIKKVTVKK